MNGQGQRGSRRTWILVATLAATLVLLAILVSRAMQAISPEVFVSRTSLEAFLKEQGARAPLVLMGLQAAQVVLAPIPGHLLGAVSGLAFGVWYGTLYTVIGVGAGSAIVLAFTRGFGRPLVERFVPPHWLQSVDRWAARGGPVFFFLFFMVPFVPDDLACFAVGLSSLPLLPMLALIIVARLPGHFVAAWFGATASHLPVGGWIAIVVFAVLALVLYARQRRRIESWLIDRLERTRG